MIGLCHIFAGGEDFAHDAAVDECGEFFGLAKIDSTIMYMMGYYYINQDLIQHLTRRLSGTFKLEEIILLRECDRLGP